jgi:TonB family protein
MISICTPLSVLILLFRPGVLVSQFPDVDLSGLFFHDCQREASDLGAMQDPSEVLPKIKYRPEIRTPESLRSVKGPVKVLVDVEIDSVGNPRECRILKSTNKRFNDVALHLAHKYRFDAGEAMATYRSRSIWVMIPIGFNRK